VEEGIKYVKDVKDKDDVEAIKKASEALSKSAQAVGMKMYSANTNANAGANGEANNANTGNASGDAPKKDEQGTIEGEVVK
jgi:molecular chaperone DnaK